jgi:hypothetical protein
LKKDVVFFTPIFYPLGFLFAIFFEEIGKTFEIIFQGNERAIEFAAYIHIAKWVRIYRHFSVGNAGFS